MFVNKTGDNVKKCHFIGIGGIGMSGLARLMLNKKNEVSGSDIAASAVTDALAKAGARIFIGHSAQHILPDSNLSGQVNTWHNGGAISNDRIMAYCRI